MKIYKHISHLFLVSTVNSEQVNDSWVTNFQVPALLHFQ